jgi:hypothetical protein
MAVVPDGHKLSIHSMSLSPSICSLEGGIWLAQIDGSSDDTEAEFDAILAGVDARMHGARPHVLLSAISGSLSSLMAPADPEVTSRDGMLAWTVDAASLARATGASMVIQRWLRCIYAVGTGSTPLAQQVFVHEIASPHARAVVALVRGLGIDVRVPEAKDTAILAEVHRPEGVILSALLGMPLSKDDPVDTSAREANQAKDLAEADRDILRKQRLEAEERDALDRKLAQAGEGPRGSPVRRAPRLHRLILAVADDGDPARPALHEELLRREVPLQHQHRPGRCWCPREAISYEVQGVETAISMAPPERLGEFTGSCMPAAPRCVTMFCVWPTGRLMFTRDRSTENSTRAD